MKLAGKRALVTGGDQGIGQAIALRLAEEGADVAINYRKNRDGADQTRGQIEKLGRRAATVQANVGVAAGAQRVVSDAIVSPSDPRMISTLARIREDLASDSLVSRYRIGQAAHDGLPGNEGSFTICSFWLVEAAARAGMVEEAQLLFEKTLSCANHLGLFSEEIGAKGELLGNFPQALTHLGLISAAHNLDRILG